MKISHNENFLFLCGLMILCLIRMDRNMVTMGLVSIDGNGERTEHFAKESVNCLKGKVVFEESTILQRVENNSLVWIV